MINLPWYAVGVFITLAVMALIFAVATGTINLGKKEVVFTSVFFIPFGKKGLETKITKAIIYAMIAAAISFALFYAIDPKGLADIFTRVPV